MAKVYLSAAAHANDNPTKCHTWCGENIHSIQYMDIVEKRLKELGIEVRRGYRNDVGLSTLTNRVNDANRWGADLYYVAHTNAGGARYSLTMCWGDPDSLAKAQIFHKYRKCVDTHKITTRKDLLEIKLTRMTCLYDELIFHDNAKDCNWFHQGGMELLAEETVQAICEILDVKYRSVTDSGKDMKAGKAIYLKDQMLYKSSTGSDGYLRSGTFYLYDGKEINGRYRVTNKYYRVGKKPLWMYVSGWVTL